MFIGGTTHLSKHQALMQNLLRGFHSDLLNESDSVMFFLFVFVSILSVLQQQQQW